MSVFTNPAGRSQEQAGAYVAAVLDLLGSNDAMEVLRRTPHEVLRLLGELTSEQITRPERAGSWSIRHVVQHLADSELVWGFRLRMVLAHDRPQLAGYDQDLWSERLGYDQADAHQAAQEFNMLRSANLRLLSRATSADLERVSVHAERGEESVKHMMRLYAGHDLLHLRQIARIRQAVGS